MEIYRTDSVYRSSCDADDIDSSSAVVDGEVDDFDFESDHTHDYDDDNAEVRFAVKDVTVRSKYKKDKLLWK